jgi:hypothetical protein
MFLKHELERQSQLNKGFADHKRPLRPIVISSNAQLLSPPISDVFGRVTGLLPDLPGRCSYATSLTLSSPFNSPRHPLAWLIPSIDHLPFTADILGLITSDSSFDIQCLIAANSSLSVRLPPSRCDGPNPTSPHLPLDRWHTLWPYHIVQCYPDELR